MDLDAFRRSLAEPEPPVGLGHAMQALWWDGKGEWDRAHDCAQAADHATGDAGEAQRAGASVHAYLHRKEGDLANADYWYRRAGRPAATGAVESEWVALAAELLRRP